MRYGLIFMAALTLTAAAGCATGSGVDLVELKNGAAEDYSAGDYDAAMKKYERLLSRAPDDAEGWFRLGNIHARRQEPEKAAAAYEKTLSLEPSFSPAWRNLAVIRLRQGRAALIMSQAGLPEDHPLNESNRRMLDLLELALSPGEGGEDESR